MDAAASTNKAHLITHDFGLADIDLSTLKGIDFFESGSYSNTTIDLPISKVTEETGKVTKSVVKFQDTFGEGKIQSPPLPFTTVQHAAAFLGKLDGEIEHPIKGGNLKLTDDNLVILSKKSDDIVINVNKKLGEGAAKIAFLANELINSIFSVYLELNLDKKDESKQRELNNEGVILKLFKGIPEKDVILQLISTVKNVHSPDIVGLLVEFCPHGDLNKFLDSDTYKHLSNDNKWQLLEDCAKALVVLDKHQVHHRDIKPDNFYVYFDDTLDMYRIKLADFGYATKLEDEVKDPRSLGTPPYIAPEYYIANKEINEYLPNEKNERPDYIKDRADYIKSNIANLASDMFSMGVTLYNMRNDNYNPICLEAENVPEVFNKLINLNQALVDEDFPFEDDPLDMLNKRMMSVDPAKRPSPQELYDTVKNLRIQNLPFQIE